MRFVVPTLLLAGLGLGGFSCPVPTPQPTPTPTPTVEPTPEPTTTPTPCAVDESKLVVVEGVRPAMTAAVISAMTPLGDTTGKPPAQTLETLAAGIRAAGNCAVAGQEAVFVHRPDSLWDEFHAVYFGNGALIPGGKWMAAHKEGGLVATLCGEPVPPPMRDFNVHVGKQWVDATPSLYGCGYKGPGTNFCRDIGLGEMPGQPGVERCDCPAGNEDNPAKRAACERQVVGGKALWRSSTGVEVNPDNHLQARCSTACAWLEVCRADGTKCTRVSQ